MLWLLDAYTVFIFGRCCRYDEFLQCYRFIQAHQTQDEANDEDGGGGLQAQSQTHWQTIRRSLSFGLRVPAKRRPDLKKGRVTWCCCNCGPQLDPNRLRPLVNFIIFQNAMAMAQVSSVLPSVPL